MVPRPPRGAEEPLHTRPCNSVRVTGTGWGEVGSRPLSRDYMHKQEAVWATRVQIPRAEQGVLGGAAGGGEAAVHWQALNSQLCAAGSMSLHLDVSSPSR